MKLKDIIILLLTASLPFVGCRKPQEGNGPQDRNTFMDVNLVEVKDISREHENLWLISLRLSDKACNSVDIVAGSTVKYLEGGRYSLVADNAGNRDFTVSVSMDGNDITLHEGSMSVTRSNDRYTLSLLLKGRDISLQVLVKGKNIYFEKDILDPMPKAEGVAFVSDEKIHSKVLDREMLYSFYLPKSYDGVKEFPILYILHGMWGTNDD